MRALMDGTGLSEIATGVEPAHRTRQTETLTGRLGHDVSILLGVGRQVGWQPGAKVSMTIKRPPQHGHGQGSTRGASGANTRLRLRVGGRWGDIEERTGGCDALGAVGGSKEPVVADAV